MPDLDELKRVLGVDFNEPSLLEQAVVHSSYINENPGAVPGHNERLEFLGDAVLGCIVAEKLYQESPELDEGDMTKLRAALVSRDALAGAARAIRLGDYLYMGKGEEKSGGRGKTPNLAGALEAVIAAVYIDSGVDVVCEMVMRLLEKEFTGALHHGMTTDYKSRLQEVAQSRFQALPVYRLVSETGPDHDKRFTVEVTLGDRSLGRGAGKSKKLAETAAARMALEQIEKGFT